MSATEKNLASSRPIGVAAELGAHVLEPAAIFARNVVLTGQFDALASPNGRLCFLNSLRLLARIVGNLDVSLPGGLDSLRHEVQELSVSLWSQGSIRITEVDETTFIGAEAILNIGPDVRPDLPWTSILANGWVARCTSGSTPLPSEVSQANPIACLLAASFGVTEVFKRIYRVPLERAGLVEDIAFSLFELSNEFAGFGPPLPDSIRLPESLLLGGGAIGNGLVLLLSQLPLEGRMSIVDKQKFGAENFGTCILLDSPAWIGVSKATALAAWLNSRSALDVQGEMTTIEMAIADSFFGNRVDLVMNGLDDVEARRAVQKLWPSLIVDGAINSAGAAVVTHNVQYRKFACLRCNFAAPEANVSALQEKATGLASSSLKGDQNRLILDEDIAQAREADRAWLRDQQGLGQTICSTVSSAMATRLGLKLAAGFKPSVPFVATAAAALVMAQVLRNLVCNHGKFIHEFQFSSLFVGASTGVKLGRLARADCECTKHAGVVDVLIVRRKDAQIALRTGSATDG